MALKNEHIRGRRLPQSSSHRVQMTRMAFSAICLNSGVAVHFSSDGNSDVLNQANTFRGDDQASMQIVQRKYISSSVVLFVQKLIRVSVNTDRRGCALHFLYNDAISMGTMNPLKGRLKCRTCSYLLL